MCESRHGRRWWTKAACAAWLCAGPWLVNCGADDDAHLPPLRRRPAWTTSRVVGSPEPPRPYTTAPAFPALRFDHPLDLAVAPGTDRIFVAQQDGKIFSFRNDPRIEHADLAADLRAAIPGAREIYALTFHPDFPRNRYLYVCYIGQAGLDDGTHVARFVVKQSDPPVVDVSTETTIITWLSGGHNGCCLKFGPDGCLYISTGDGVGPNPPDTRRTGQSIDDLLSSILRLDVDHPQAGRNYGIPADNPFVDRPGARGEIWAYGLRNPWRMSFDRRTGDLWVGDVGWELWEMLHRVERGGNYGWSVREGRQPIHPEWPRGPTPIIPPVIDHPHTESSSITDGLTYYGAKLGELQGTHIYGDYDTGKIWGFRYEDGAVKHHRELADTTHRIVGFGEDDRHELLLIDHVAGTLHRLVPNPRRRAASSFPHRLSETGIFADVESLEPAPGVVEYGIAAEPWSDFADTRRWIALPGQTHVNVEKPKWRFPPGTVFAKTLTLNIDRGGSDSAPRPVETQLLHFDGREWHAYSYRWNDAGTDALLVDKNGSSARFTIADRRSPGGVRRQTWRFAGRAECGRCHNPWSGPVLGFEPRQLDREMVYRGTRRPQLVSLAQLGVLNHRPAVPRPPALVDPYDRSLDVAARARSYLHVNCAHCHRKHAGGSVLIELPIDVPLDRMHLVDALPSQGRFGIPDVRVVAPGDPYRSVLWYRMAKLGPGRMPHIGSTEIDAKGVSLIHDWILELRGASPAKANPSPLDAVLDAVASVDSHDAACRAADRLLRNPCGALRLLYAIDTGRLPPERAAIVARHAASRETPAVRELFERFLPPDERTKRLGAVIRPDEILKQVGDAARGRRLFFETDGVACKSCHRIGDRGGSVGPDLTHVGSRQTRAQLLESILEPSRRIAPEFVTYLAETRDGRIHTGLLVAKDASHIVLKDAQGKTVRLASDAIESLVPQPKSLMPELLLRDMTLQQVADLLAFLASCR